MFEFVITLSLIVGLFTGISFESLTYSFIVVEVVVPLEAVIFIINGSPTALAGGFPLNFWVVGSKLNQLGRALPFPKVAVYVNVVLANGLLNVSAGIEYSLLPLPLNSIYSGNGFAKIGFVKLSLNVMIKVSVAGVVLPSVAVTVIDIVSAFFIPSGVPLNFPVFESKLSQLGSGSPFDNFAL